MIILVITFWYLATLGSPAFSRLVGRHNKLQNNRGREGEDPGLIHASTQSFLFLRWPVVLGMPANQYTHQISPKVSTGWPKVANVYKGSWLVDYHEIYMIFFYMHFISHMLCFYTWFCFHDELCDVYTNTNVLGIKLTPATMLSTRLVSLPNADLSWDEGFSC